MTAEADEAIGIGVSVDDAECLRTVDPAVDNSHTVGLG
jgi:hypothetical protein